MAAKLVGSQGKVIGVDMTRKQLAVAQTRFGRSFRATGDTAVYFSPFDCASAAAPSDGGLRNGGG
jgi:hypothetical protein